MTRPSIAIIGAGFSGSALALNLLAVSFRADPQIFLFEKSDRFGRGLAYGSACTSHLMNVRARHLHAGPGCDGFEDWLAHGRAEACDGSFFAERGAFGAYVESQMRRAARKNARLHLVRDTVMECRPKGRAIELRLSSGAIQQVDAAIVAIGHQAPKPPTPFDQPSLSARLLDPWRADLEQIDAKKRVLLLGSGLTMVDAVVRLATPHRTGALIALSRRGLLPEPHAQASQTDGAPLWLEGALSERLRRFRKEVEAAQILGASWQETFDRLRPDTAALWMSLPLAAQQRFLRHLRPYWDIHRHRMPPQIHRWMRALIDSKLLDVRAGRVIDATENRQGEFEVSYAPRGSHDRRKIIVDHIVNCTGACADLSQSSAPLIKQLFAEGIARPHASGLGLDVEHSGRLIGANGRSQRNVFALGPITQGAFWESTAVPEIRANAAALSRTVLALLESTRAAPAFAPTQARTNAPARPPLS